MPTDTTNIEKKLDEILEHMKRMDNRDKWRTIGRFIYSFTFFILVIWSTVYFIMSGPELLKSVTDMSVQAAKQAAAGDSSTMINDIKQKYGIQ